MIPIAKLGDSYEGSEMASHLIVGKITGGKGNHLQGSILSVLIPGALKTLTFWFD
jgi:hypothetical protein